MRLSLSAALALLSLAACAERVVEVGVPFDAAATRAAMSPGTNTVEGQGFLRQAGGGVVTCAGEEVQIYPATAFAKARVAALHGTSEGGILRAFEGASQDNLPPEYISTMRRTICDADGNFVFSGLADGEYFVTTVVVWKVGNSWIPEGGRITRPVRVNGGSTARALLNA